MRIASGRLALLFMLSMCAGCGAHIELQRGAVPVDETLDTSRFYLMFEDGSTSKPDNLDGYLNLMWTSDAKRVAVVADHLQYLKTELKAHGFTFVETAEDSTVLANLKIKSVRYDPVAGWITDDARIVYSPTSGGADFGIVVADEIWFTPTVKMVFEALVRGSLELWGHTSDE
jgi:hypothetical protein